MLILEMIKYFKTFCDYFENHVFEAKPFQSIRDSFNKNKLSLIFLLILFSWSWILTWINLVLLTPWHHENLYTHTFTFSPFFYDDNHLKECTKNISLWYDHSPLNLQLLLSRLKYFQKIYLVPYIVLSPFGSIKKIWKHENINNHSHWSIHV